MRAGALLLALIACSACDSRGCSFTTPVAMYKQQAGIAFDLTQSSLPSGITSTRTGGTTLYPARSASTVVAITGADVYEDRGDGRGGGHWVFDAYRNSASPFNFSTSPWIDSGMTFTTSIGAGPDGATQGTRLTDGSAGTSHWVGFNDTTVNNDKHTYASLWVRDSAVTPTVNGAMLVGGGAKSVSFGSGASWHRISTMWQNVSGNSYGVFTQIFPAGATVDRAGTITQDATKTGSIEAWGAQMTQSSGDVPLAATSTAAATLTVDTPANLLLPNGDLHIEGAFLLQAQNYFAWERPAWTLGDQYALSITTAGGEQGIYWTGSESFWKAEKGDGTTTTGVQFSNHIYTSHEVRWEFWNRPHAGGGGANIWLNGCRYGGDASRSSMRWTAVAQNTPTAAYLNSKLGAANSFMNAQVTMLRRIDSPIVGRRSSTDPDASEGVILGDSVLAPKAAAGPMTGSLIYTFAEGRSRLGIVSYATSGNRISDQLSQWQADAQRGRSDVRWVIVQLGINDITAGSNDTTIAAALSGLIADINTNNPTATVFLSPITPCRSELTGGQYTVWQAVNQDIAGTGAHNVTGTFTRLSPWTSLNDGSDNLLTQYRDIDGTHPNDLGRAIQAAAFRAALVSAGLL